MFPAVKRALSPTSLMGGSNNQDGEVESYADTYFREIGFKIGENSLMGSTESPDLDGEEMLHETDRSLGLLDENSLGTDVEPAVGGSETNYGRQAAMAEEPSLAKPSRNKLTMAQAYNAPFHSYFGQVLNNDRRDSPRDSYAISYENNAADDVSISTLGEESIKRKPSPMYAQHRQQEQRNVCSEKKTFENSAPFRQQLNPLELKKAGTGITLDERPSQDSVDRAKHSKHSRSTARTLEEKQMSTKRRRLVYLVIGVALILLASASVVLGVTFRQLRDSSDDPSEEAPTSTWIPEIQIWTPSPSPAPSARITEARTDAPTVRPNMEPTFGPVELARQDLFQLISAVSPASLSSINDTSTPQYLAFEWAVNDPEYLDYSVDRVVRRWTMAVLYFSLGGEASTLSNRRLEGSDDNATMVHWLSYVHECLWYSTDDGDICDAENRLIGLHLTNVGLAGTIPPEISLLGSTLERLYLADNRINGTLPSQLGDLLHLVRLQLTSNGISGSMPSELGNLSHLTVLGLGRNELTGYLPTSFGEMHHLKTLGLEGNFLRGNIPSEFGDMNSLELLSLEANQFNGSIPKELGMLDNLELFSLHQNELEGEMPFEFCTAKNRTTLVLSADCMEVTCECCTLCCYGCHGDNGGVLVEATEAPTRAPTFEPSPLPSLSPANFPSAIPTRVPTQHPTQLSTIYPTQAPTGLFEMLKPAITKLQNQATETPTAQPDGNPLTIVDRNGITNFPSATPSNPTSVAPSSAPTECEVIVTVVRTCYERNGQGIDVEFDNCEPQAEDWIGLFKDDYFISIPVGNDAPSFDDAETWLRTCGDQECTTTTTFGTVSLGGDRLQAKEGNYRVIFVKSGARIATSQPFEISRKCD